MTINRASGAAPTDAPQPRYEARDALLRVIAHGVGIKDFYDKSPDNAPESYHLDPALWRPSGRYKAFIRGRFLVLDIDRKPADISADPERGDGLRNFERWLERVGKPPDMRPPELRDVADASFPCSVITPSSGLHLYFKTALHRNAPANGNFVSASAGVRAALHAVQKSRSGQTHAGSLIGLLNSTQIRGGVW
jgi:hypothetical protein